VQLTKRRSKEQLKRKVRKWKRHKKERKGMGRGEKKEKEWRRVKEKEERSILIRITEEEVISAVGFAVMGPLAFSLLVVLLE